MNRLDRLGRRVERVIVCPTWLDRTAVAIIILGIVAAVILTNIEPMNWGPM